MNDHQTEPGKNRWIVILVSALLFISWDVFGMGGASAESNGLYYVSSVESGPEARTDSGSIVRLGEKASIQILLAHVYSENNANTDFEARLETSEYPVDPKSMGISRPVVLKVGDHGYNYSGGGGRTGGPYNLMWFKIHGQEEAQTAAKWLSVKCHLRSPPGYRLHAQFVPGNSDYHTNEPVAVKFELKNLDDREVIFRRGGQQRGPRDNQYGFRAMRYGSGARFGGEAVPDVGDANHFGGMSVNFILKPEQVFEDKVDLKKWFAFDKPGTYTIHGFYGLTLYGPSLKEESFMPWTVIWADYASADFSVIVK